jgi:hypothetical protein
VKWWLFISLVDHMKIRVAEYTKYVISARWLFCQGVERAGKCRITPPGANSIKMSKGLIIANVNCLFPHIIVSGYRQLRISFHPPPLSAEK